MFPQIVQTKLKIVQKKKINHDCYIYKFKWQGESFALEIGQHLRINQIIKTKQNPEGEQVVRKYTPISPCSQKDSVDILFKIYRPSEQFPQGGKLTNYIESLKQGDTLNVQGPFGRFGYQAGGIVTIDGQQLKMKRLFFIAGGSGITPCYQTIRQIANMKEQTIEMILLFANKSEEDIVLRKQLEELQPRIKLYYVVDKGTENWKGFTGYVNKKLLNEVCPLDQKDTLYIHCGPPPMNKAIRQLFTADYPESKLFKY